MPDAGTTGHSCSAVYRALGIDLAATARPDHTGRPIHLLDDCEPIGELF